jgi:predicted cation transporter
MKTKHPDLIDVVDAEFTNFHEELYEGLKRAKGFLLFLFILAWILMGQTFLPLFWVGLFWAIKLWRRRR